MRLKWVQLEALLDQLTSELQAGAIDLQMYVDEWDRIVTFAGWTWEQFADEVDRHWTPEKKASSPLFRS